MDVKVINVVYEDLRKSARFAESLRGYLGNKYIENDLLHNHKEDKLIYRYPLVQYKVIENKPMILGINEGVEIVSQISLNDDEFIIDSNKIETYQKSINKEIFDFGVAEDYITYEFKSIWVALNQKNIVEYKKLNDIGKEELLKKTLIGNIISLARGMNYQVEKRISCWLDVKERTVMIKGVRHIGFIGRFKVNFNIPNYIGIGKAVSKGFGTIKAINKK